MTCDDRRTACDTGRSPGENPEMNTIRFSLIILTYNRHDLLRNCIDSAVHQDYQKGYEIVVVNDGSTDSTQDLVGELMQGHPNIVGIRHEKNQGVGAARNTGIRNANGRYIAFIADDYVLPEDYLSQAEKFFSEYPDAAIMSCRLLHLNDNYWDLVHYYLYDTIYERLHFLSPITLQKTFQYIFLRLPPLPPQKSSYFLPPRPAAVFRREVLEKFQFDATLRSNEDAAISIRLRDAGIPVYLNSDIAIKASFEGGLRDYARKEYTYGKDSLLCEGEEQSLARAVAQLFGGIIDALIVVRQTTDLKEYVSLFPGVLCVIIAFRAGYAAAFFRRFIGSDRDRH